MRNCGPVVSLAVRYKHRDTCCAVPGFAGVRLQAVLLSSCKLRYYAAPRTVFCEKDSVLYPHIHFVCQVHNVAVVPLKTLLSHARRGCLHCKQSLTYDTVRMYRLSFRKAECNKTPRTL